MNTITQLRTGLTIIALILGLGFSGMAQSTAQESTTLVINALKNNQYDKLISYFNNPVDITLGDRIDDSYSKTQGGMIVKKFLKEHEAQNFELKQTGSANDGSTFIIGLYTDKHGKVYRVYLLIKKLEGEYSIHLFEMEEE